MTASWEEGKKEEEEEEEEYLQPVGVLLSISSPLLRLRSWFAVVTGGLRSLLLLKFLQLLRA